MKKNVTFLLFLISFVVFLSGCENKKTEEVKKKEFYTYDEFEKTLSEIDRKYKKETEYKTEEEINAKKIYKKICEKMNLQLDKKMKVRGKFDDILGLDISLYDKKESGDDAEKYKFQLAKTEYNASFCILKKVM